MPRGGFRPGAGRKPRNHSLAGQADAFGTTPSASTATQKPQPRRSSRSPLKLLLDVVADESIDIDTRMKAALSALPYTNGKPPAIGKKEQQREAARRASTGRSKFATRPAPNVLPFGKKS